MRNRSILSRLCTLHYQPLETVAIKIFQQLFVNAAVSQRMRRLDGSSLEHCRHALVIACILLHSFLTTSPISGSSTPEHCHPEDVLLYILVGKSDPDGVLRWPSAAGRAAHVDRFVRGVSQGSRYESRLSLVKLKASPWESRVHQEWSEWREIEGTVEQEDQVQRISFAVPPLPAGRYTEHLEVYDACGLAASLSAFSASDKRLRLLAGLHRVVNVEEAEQGT